MQVRDRGVLRSVLMKPALSRENHSSASLSSRLDRSSWSRPPAGVASAVKSWYLGAQNSYLGSTLPPLGGVHSIPSSDIGKTLCYSTTDPPPLRQACAFCRSSCRPNGLDPGPFRSPTANHLGKMLWKSCQNRGGRGEGALRGARGARGWEGGGRTRALGTWTIRPPEIWLVR